jgi:hypothetical protein
MGNRSVSGKASTGRANALWQFNRFTSESAFQKLAYGVPCNVAWRFQLRSEAQRLKPGIRCGFGGTILSRTFSVVSAVDIPAPGLTRARGARAIRLETFGLKPGDPLSDLDAARSASLPTFVRGSRGLGECAGSAREFLAEPDYAACGIGTVDALLSRCLINVAGGVSFAPPGLVAFSFRLPTACAVGCILSLLRSWGAALIAPIDSKRQWVYLFSDWTILVFIEKFLRV